MRWLPYIRKMVWEVGMKGCLVGLLAIFCTAGLGFAQPCTLVSVEPLRWPEGVPTEDVIVERVGYAMGVYTLDVSSGPPSYRVPRGWPVVSRDGRNWVLANLKLQHERQPNRDEYSGLLPPVFANGVWVALFSDGDFILRSNDGFNWEEAGYGFDPTIGYHHNGGLFWNGKEFLKVGFWGAVYASANARDFVELQPVPNLYPLRWVSVSHLGAIGTDQMAAGGTYVTRDFISWHSVPSNGADLGGAMYGWFYAFANVGPDPHVTEDRLVRSRDGKTFRFVNSDKAPGIPGPRDTRFGSIKYWVAADDSGRSLEIYTMTGARNAVPTRIVEFDPKADLGSLHALDFGHKFLTFDGREVLFLGGEYSGRRATAVRLARFSCADFGAPLVLPGMAHQDGALGTRWRSDLVLHYPGPGGSEVRLEWLPYGQANENPRFARVWLNSGETKVIHDVVASLFQAEGNGAVRVVWLGEEKGLARGRTYNEASSGSFGQSVEAFGWEDGVGRCYVPENESDDPNNVPASWQDEEEMWLVGLADSGSDTEGFRTNVGLQNLWRNEAEVEVVWMGAQGQELGRKQVHLRAFEGVQWFRPLRELGLGPLEGVTAVVRVLTGDTRVAAYASIVDNRTGDGVFVRGKKDLFQGLTLLPWEQEGATMPKPSATSAEMLTGLQKPFGNRPSGPGQAAKVSPGATSP